MRKANQTCVTAVSALRPAGRKEHDGITYKLNILQNGFLRLGVQFTGCERIWNIGEDYNHMHKNYKFYCFTKLHCLTHCGKLIKISDWLSCYTGPVINNFSIVQKNIKTLKKAIA